MTNDTPQDYLEYRFGTLKSLDERNYILGGKLSICIPYYVFVGRLISSTTLSISAIPRSPLSESPYLSPRQHLLDLQAANNEHSSKESQAAVINLTARLPLPSTFYQNGTDRVYYDETLQKHTQFKNEFIYAFTWEDSRVDQHVLKITSEDVILCITSAGDNLLDYLYSANPKRVHAVDLNPNQNHLLELKVAAFQALPYADFWRMFGEGRHAKIEELLLTKLSPHMSSQALQFWLTHTRHFTSNGGLYAAGGSGYAISFLRKLFTYTGLNDTVKRFCEAKTLNEQRELWPKLRSVLMNKVLHWAVVGSSFLWKAAGVPPAQANMISNDYEEDNASDAGSFKIGMKGEALWQYICDTLDPVVRHTLLSDDNFYYTLALAGQYNRR